VERRAEVALAASESAPQSLLSFASTALGIFADCQLVAGRTGDPGP